MDGISAELRKLKPRFERHLGRWHFKSRVYRDLGVELLKDGSRRSFMLAERLAPDRDDEGPASQAFGQEAGSAGRLLLQIGIERLSRFMPSKELAQAVLDQPDDRYRWQLVLPYLNPDGIKVEFHDGHNCYAVEDCFAASVSAIETLVDCFDSDDAPAAQATSEPRFLFKKCGKYYDIRFGDERGHLPKYLGADDYVRLLKSPHVPVSCFELSGDVLDGEKKSNGKSDNQQRLNAIRERMVELSNDLGRCSGTVLLNGGEEQAQDELSLTDYERHKYREEFDTLAEEAKKLSGIRGARGTDSRARARVAKRMKDFRETLIRAGLPKFAEYLELNVDTGTDCVYRPSPTDAPGWVF